MACGLTPQEFRDLRAVFDVYDTTASGAIDREDLRRVIKVLGFRASRRTLDELARETEQKEGRSGKVSFDSFTQIVEKLQGDAYDTQGELVQAFQHMVQDGSDSLTVEDIRAVCLSVGLRLTAEELQGMMEEADLNGDGRVSREEFMTIMLRTNLFK